jgi:hypothetical protein
MSIMDLEMVPCGVQEHAPAPGHFVLVIAHTLSGRKRHAAEMQHGEMRQGCHWPKGLRTG